MTFVYLMNNQKPLNKEIIKSHAEYLRGLESQGKLDYPGGMVIILAEDLIEATNIANSDPFIASGFKSYEIRTLKLANEANNYLL